MLPYLCVEVLQEIGGQLPNSDQMNLRSVCKELNLAIDPLFYTFFLLRGDRIRGENGLHILGRLATGQIGWSHHCKTLRIMPGCRAQKGEDLTPKWYPSNTELPNLLVTAIASMQNIQTVIWNVQAKDPDWVREAICDSLNTLPHLSSLQVETEGGVRLQMTPLPRLKQLKIDSSDWRTVPMEEICQVVGRGHHLASLHLTGYHDWSNVWTMLRATTLRSSANARIYLKDLGTTTVTADLLAYLSSYSGVERLSLERSHGNRTKNDALANTFFDDVLKQHAKSLVELSCPACHEGRWSFRMDVADAILQLRKLEKLHMSVNGADVVDVEPGMNSVTLLLNTAALLPALRILTISSHSVYTSAGIKTAIEDFTSHLESTAIVCTGQDYYALAPAISDEGGISTILAYRKLDPESPAVRALRIKP
ncbi:F-box domain-containing protein [Mycena venus]|uniref:F-box domain-containing protein n=1 Tax=Mycena venus TaxID=2733690 RepID=A0A8H6XSP7_9AGAR|nr:F-box domain-containing protein [Mycena venus]